MVVLGFGLFFVLTGYRALLFFVTYHSLSAS